MWKDFYNFSSKDSTSLKNSTTIPFNLWQQVTDLLLNNDAQIIPQIYIIFQNIHFKK